MKAPSQHLASWVAQPGLTTHTHAHTDTHTHRPCGCTGAHTHAGLVYADMPVSSADFLPTSDDHSPDVASPEAEGKQASRCVTGITLLSP